MGGWIRIRRRLCCENRQLMAGGWIYGSQPGRLDGWKPLRRVTLGLNGIPPFRGGIRLKERGTKGIFALNWQ